MATSSIIYLMRSSCAGCVVFASVLALLACGSIVVQAQNANGLASPPIVRPFPSSTRTLDGTIGIGDLTTAGTATAVLAAIPTPNDYTFRTVRRVRAYVVFHAGGDRQTYEFGKTAWSATVTGRLYGFKAGTPDIDQTIVASITLQINQGIPEAVYVVPETDPDFQPENHPYYAGGTATKYDELRFEIDDPDGFARTNTDIDPHLRLSIRVDEEVVYEFPSTYNELRCSARVSAASPSSVLSVTCQSPAPGTPDLRVQKVSGSEVYLEWKTPDFISGNQITEYEVELLRLYNIDPTKRGFSATPSITARVDWSAAKRFAAKTSPGSGGMRIIPIDGTGYYAFRVRPVTSVVDGGASSPKNLGRWSQSPADGSTITVEPCSTAHGASVFYFDDQQSARSSMTRQVSMNDTARGSYIDEVRTYHDALGRTVQTVARDRALGSAIVTGVIYDRDGRPSLQTLPASRMLGTTHNDGMGYTASLLRHSSNAMYTVDNYDNVGTTLTSPTTVDAVSPGARYFSDANADVSIPSAGGYPFARTLYTSDGRPMTTILPGADRRPAAPGDQKARSGRTLQGNVSQTSLDAVFGAESPNARSIEKIVTITPDLASFGQWRGPGGQVLATFAIANEAQVPGNPGTLASIANDGDATLALPNGDIGTHTASEQTLEKVLIAEENVQMPAEFARHGDTLVTTTKVALTSRSSIRVVVTYTPSAPATVTYGSEGCTTTFLVNCNESMFVRVFRVDTVPFLQITNSVPAMPQPFVAPGVSATTYTFGDLPPGEYVVERRLISGGKNALGRTPLEEVLAASMPAADVATSLQTILAMCFGPSPNPSVQLSHYNGFRNSLPSPHVLKAKIGAGETNKPCYEIPLPQPIECATCPDGSAMPFDKLRYAQYAMDRFALKFPGAPKEDVFFSIGPGGARVTKIAGSTADVERRVNKIFEGLLTATDCEYSCRDLWLIWTGLVDRRIDALAPPTGPGMSIPTVPKVPPGGGDIFESLFLTVGLCIDDAELEADVVTDNTIDSDAEALAMYQHIRPGTSTPAERSACILMHTRAVGLVTWNNVNACLWSKVSPADARQIGRLTGTGVPPTPGQETKLLNELKADFQDSCRNNCEKLYAVVYRQLREQNPGISDGELYCKERAIIDDCRASCVVSNPPSTQEINKLKAMTGGRLHVTSPVGVTCPEGYEYLPNPNINSRRMVTALIDYLNDHYDRLRRSVKVNTCVNYARVIYNFLNDFIPGQIPACIVAASELGPEIGIEADCRLFENNPNLNQFYIRVLPGVPGSFVRPQGIGDCDVCAIEFTGPRFAKSTLNPPTLDPTEHEWVSLFNQLVDDAWGATVGARSRQSSTEFLASDSLRRWYEYASKVPELDSAGNSNVDSLLNAIITAARNDLHAASAGVNGLRTPLLYFNHGAAGITPAPQSWLTPAWTPFGTIYGFDNAAWRIHDSTHPHHMQWRNFGTIGIQFDDRLSSFDPNSGFVSYLAWTLLPASEDSSIDDIRLVSQVVGENYTDEWSSTEPGSEYRGLTDSLFTRGIGKFYMTDQWKLGYHDLIRNRRTVIDAVWFYTTHSRRLIASQGPAACTWDSLCLKEIGCSVCFKWDTLSVDDIDDVRRDGPRPCDGVEIERLKAEISRLYYESLDRFRSFAEQSVSTRCGVNTNASSIAVRTTERTYHYTLYYYDRAGRLVRTVSPKGVDMSPSRTRSSDPEHTFVSRFSVDSRGRILTKAVPDGGQETYHYDRLGRLRFSVDAVQAAASPKRMTYYKYDRYSRITETGEVVLAANESIASAVGQHLDHATTTEASSNPWPGATDARARNDVARYFYDEKAASTSTFSDPLSRWAAVTGKLTGVSQRNVRGRLSWALAVPSLAANADVSATTTDVVRTYFSYDPHGNTISSISSVPYGPTSTANADFLITRTDYSYDLSTGALTRVDFQPTVPEERFIHRYTYDASGRMKYVETSRNDVLFDRDAAYDYTMTGMLKRETIGEDSVQGRDYTYTLLGQIKGINHPALDPAKDPGRDGVASTTANPNPNANVAKDAFGMAFHYHANDFVHTTNGTPSVFADGQPGMLGVAQPNGAPAYDLYSGQIGAWSMKTQEIPAATLNGATLLRNGTLVGERFRYDVLGRLREDTTYSHDGTSWLSDGAGGWSASFRYDQNSNIRKVKRWAMTGATQSQMIDDAVVLSNSAAVNSVNQIVDVGASLPANPSEISSLTPPAGAGLTNSAGQFIEVPTAVNPIEIEYNSTGVVDVYHATNSELRYIRDPFGFHSRVDKYQTSSATTSFQRSFYPIVIDGRSDRAVYQRTAEQPIPELDQWTIMSTRRLGVRHWSNEGAPLGNISLRSMGDVRYELSLTTGTVAGTITDVKVPTSAGYHAEMVTVGSYDLYGGEHWNRTFSSVAPYRYGWHGLRSLLGEDERSHYYTPFRLYDVRMGSWTSRDKVLSTGMGPYTGMDASPIDAVDPDGLLVIFVNGFRFGGQGTVTVRNVYLPRLGPTLTNGQFAQVISSNAPYFLRNREAIWRNARAPVYDTDINGYWGDFAPRFMDLLGDHNDVYLDGSAGPVSEAWEREAAGIAAGNQLVDDIRSGKVKLADGEIITIVSHSQGDAYGGGLTRTLVAAGIPVHTIYRIAPKQPEDIQTHPSVKRSVQLFSPVDFTAPQAAVPGNGATQMVYWRLPEEFRPRLKLPGSVGRLLGESLFLKTGGFHTIDSYLPYVDPTIQLQLGPERIIPLNEINEGSKGITHQGDKE